MGRIGELGAADLEACRSAQKDLRVPHRFEIFLILLAVLAGAALLAKRLNVAPAVMLLMTGVGLALVPGLPRLELEPEIVLLIVLPPLIYSASVAMSWRDFRLNLRPITLLAFGCVIFTAASVAAVTHYFGGLSWSIGFLLGAIVAPPDAVAPLAIARRLKLPRQVLVVLEGEGLVNDATALIMYRFAIAAIATGMFSLRTAAGEFALIVAGEIVYGLFVGWASLLLRNRVRDPQVEITLSLITPYLAYWLPEHLGGSGVLATVVCGLYVSWNGPLLISAATRLQGIFFWDLVIYLTEGLLFLMTGAQLRLLLEKSQDFNLPRILTATVIVAVTIVVARFVWVFARLYLGWLACVVLRTLRIPIPLPPLPLWRHTFVVAFTGVRGAVSLAAALALPLTVASGAPFPDREVMLFIVFGVILITLVGLGLTLPMVVNALGIANIGHEEHRAEYEAEITARRNLLAATRASIDDMAKSRQLPEDVVDILCARHLARSSQVPGDDGESAHMTKGSARLVRELISEERKFIHRLLREGQITDEARRRIERDLDLEEAMLSNLGYR
jgi:CPA1 family monovalent cation:H+ antiporter